jgi:tryptophan-rich sensory protein
MSSLVIRWQENIMARDRTPHGLSPLWAAGLAIGAVTAALMAGGRASPTPDHPGTRRWYRRLDKPGFTPPTPVYPIAWTGIQALLAYGGYRLLRAEPSPQRTTALALWTANQVGIGGWSEIFFGQRSPGWGTIASAALGANAAGYVVAARKVDIGASNAGIPLVAWVTFATLLSEEIWRENAGRTDVA